MPTHHSVMIMPAAANATFHARCIQHACAWTEQLSCYRRPGRGRNKL